MYAPPRAPYGCEGSVSGCANSRFICCGSDGCLDIPMGGCCACMAEFDGCAGGLWRRLLSRCGRSIGGYPTHQLAHQPNHSPLYQRTVAIPSSPLPSLSSTLVSILLRISSSKKALSSRIFMMPLSRRARLTFASSFAASTSFSLRFSSMHLR